MSILHLLIYGVLLTIVNDVGMIIVGNFTYLVPIELMVKTLSSDVQLAISIADKQHKLVQTIKKIEDLEDEIADLNQKIKSLSPSTEEYNRVSRLIGEKITQKNELLKKAGGYADLDILKKSFDEHNTTLNAALEQKFKSYYNIFNQLNTGEQTGKEFKDFAVSGKLIIDAINKNTLTEQTISSFKKAFDDIITIGSDDAIIDKDTTATARSLYYDLSGLSNAMLYVQEDKEVVISLDKAKINKNLKTLQKQTYLQVMSDLSDDFAKDLINLDGDANEIETNFFLDTKKNDWKTAKIQDKDTGGDDSHVEVAGEKFAGYPNTELAHAWKQALSHNLNSSQIQANIMTSLVANRSGFVSVLKQRFADGKVNKDGTPALKSDAAAFVKLVDSLGTPSSISSSISGDVLKAVQIYLIDYSKLLGLTPVDVMLGHANSLITVKPLVLQSNREIGTISSEAMANNIKIIKEASSLLPSDQQNLLKNLSEEKRRGLDFHITGLYAYMQKSQMSMPDNRVFPAGITPAPGGTPIDNSLYNYGDKVVSSDTLGVLSLGTALTLLDRSLDPKHSFHVDVNMIPRVSMNTDGVNYDLFVGPSGTYQFTISPKTSVSVSAFAGTSIGPDATSSSLANTVTVGATVGAAHRITGSSFGSNTKMIEGGFGGGMSLMAGPYLTGYVGMSIDRIASIQDNATKLKELFGPLIFGLTPANCASLDAFTTYIKTYNKTKGNTDIKKKYIDDLYLLIQSMQSIAGSLDKLKENSGGIFAEIVKDIYSHDSKLDLEGVRFSGGSVDILKFLTSPSIWGKLTAVFGVIKLKKYRVAFTHSDTYALSIKESTSLEKNDTAETRANKLANLYNPYFKNVVGMDKNYQCNVADRNLVFPANALVYVQGSNQTELKVGPDTEVNVVFYMNKVLIDIVPPKKETITNPQPIVTTSINRMNQILTSDIVSIDWKQENVSYEFCSKKWSSFEEMKAKLDPIKIGNSTFNATQCIKTYPQLKKYIDMKYIDVGDGSTLTKAELDIWLTNAQSYKDNYHTYFPKLTALLLAVYSDSHATLKSKQETLELYQALLRYETVMGGYYLKTGVYKNKPSLIVNHREQHLNDRISGDPLIKSFDDPQLGENLKKDRNEFIAKMRETPYQGPINMAANKAWFFTWNYQNKTTLSTTFLEKNTFVGTGKQQGSFEEVVVNHKITNPKIIELIKLQAKNAKTLDQKSVSEVIKSRVDSYKDEFIASINKQLSNQKIEGKSLQELGYTFDSEQICNIDDLYFCGTKEITLKKDGKEVPGATLTIDASASGFYMVGNVQCASNENFGFVPQWSSKIILKEEPKPVPVPGKLALGSLQFAQEVVNESNLTRVIGLGGGVGRQEGYYDPKTQPGISTGTEIVNTKPGISTGTSNGGSTGGSTSSAPNGGGFGSSGSNTPSSTPSTPSSTPSGFIATNTASHSGHGLSVNTIQHLGSTMTDVGNSGLSPTNTVSNITSSSGLSADHKLKNNDDSQHLTQSVEVNTNTTELHCVIKDHVLTIFGADDKPVAGITILWKGADGKQLTGKTDATGSVDFAVSGSYVFAIEYPNHKVGYLVVDTTKEKSLDQKIKVDQTKKTNVGVFAPMANNIIFDGSKLSSDLSDAQKKEIEDNWGDIQKSSYNKPYITKEGRRYVQTSKGVFYSIKLDKNNIWGNIEDNKNGYSYYGNTFEKLSLIDESYYAISNGVILNEDGFELNSQDYYNSKPLSKLKEVFTYDSGFIGDQVNFLSTVIDDYLNYKKITPKAGVIKPYVDKLIQILPTDVNQMTKAFVLVMTDNYDSHGYASLMNYFDANGKANDAVTYANLLIQYYEKNKDFTKFSDLSKKKHLQSAKDIIVKYNQTGVVENNTILEKQNQLNIKNKNCDLYLSVETSKDSITINNNIYPYVINPNDHTASFQYRKSSTSNGVKSFVSFVATVDKDGNIKQVIDHTGSDVTSNEKDSVPSDVRYELVKNYNSIIK